VCVLAHRIAGGVGCTQVYSHDIHEIRAYNRLGLMADSELLITLQVVIPKHIHAHRCATLAHLLCVFSQPANCCCPLQDDDTPSGSTWVAEAAALLAAHPRLIYITGYRARAGAGGNIGDGRDKVTLSHHNICIRVHSRLIVLYVQRQWAARERRAEGCGCTAW
jgi:hypothetical protein